MVIYVWAGPPWSDSDREKPLFLSFVELILTPIIHAATPWAPREGGLPLPPYYYYYQDGVCVSGSIVGRPTNNTQRHAVHFLIPSMATTATDSHLYILQGKACWQTNNNYAILIKQQIRGDILSVGHYNTTACVVCMAIDPLFPASFKMLMFQDSIRLDLSWVDIHVSWHDPNHEFVMWTARDNIRCKKKRNAEQRQWKGNSK